MANDKLTELKGLKEKAAAVHAEEARVRAEIAAGFERVAVVFLDVVDSTRFKIDHEGDPATWVLRVQQFSEVLAAAVRAAGGRVVKFIGDEVMARFNDPLDAANLVQRIDQIEAQLGAATGFPTRIKVVADVGDVYFIDFDGHDEPDPQGTPVDRCARIAKFGAPGQVLASRDFKKATSKLDWHKVGAVELKGLGKQVVYQLGQATVSLAPTVVVDQAEWEETRERVEELEDDVEELRAKNARLVAAARAAGRTPAAEDLADEADGDVETAFEAALEPARKALKGLAAVVLEALYYKQSNKPYAPPGSQWDDVLSAAEYGYLRVSEEDREAYPDVNHADVAEAVEALRELGRWLEWEAPEGFAAWYREHHRVVPSLALRSFWEAHLWL